MAMPRASAVAFAAVLVGVTAACAGSEMALISRFRESQIVDGSLEIQHILNGFASVCNRAECQEAQDSACAT
jgi:hypothetical protein